MPELERERQRRRDAAARLGAGGLMVGGAAAVQHAASQKTGMKSTLAVARDIKNTRKIKGKHAAHMGTWLGTRGVMAAGVPLAAIGAKNLMSPKPKNLGHLDVKRDVVGSAVDRSTGGVADFDHKAQHKVPRKAKAAELATVTAGSTLGGLGGAALARNAVRSGGKRRLAAIGLGTATGAITGSLAGAPLGRKAVRRVTAGEYDYSTEKGVHHVRKADVVAGPPVILPKKQAEVQQHRKHKAANLSLASAGLGVTALGLRSPAAIKYMAGKSKGLKRNKAIKRIVRMEPKSTAASWNVGIMGTGVGSAAALNSARMQRTQLKAEEGKIQKASKYRQGELHSDPEFNRHLNARTRASLARGRKPGWNTDQTFGDVSGSISHRKLNAMAKRRGHKEGWPKDMPWSESVGDTEGSEETYRHVADHTGDYSSYIPEHRPKGPKWEEKKTDLAKALFPIRVRPPRFAGVKTGGLRRVQTPTGLKQIRYRGSLG